MSLPARVPRVCNLGSINLDHVYRVPHFVRPGETLASLSYQSGAGGKGFNHSIAPDWIASALAELSPGDWLLTQNETNAVAETLHAARAAGLKTFLNPAPSPPEVAGYPLDCVDLLVVNETEGRDLSGATAPDEILDALLSRWPALAIKRF